MSLAVASVVAMVAACVAFPFEHFSCWRSWNGGSAWFGLVVFTVVSGAGAGFFGWGTAQLSHANPFSNVYANGLIYGIAGSLAFRADLRPQTGRVERKSRTEVDYQTQARQAISILTGAANRILRALDGVLFDSALRFFRGLDDDALRSQAWNVYGHIKNATDLTTAQKKEWAGWIEEAGNMLRRKGTRTEGHALLATYCARYCTNAHLTKTA